MEKTNVECNSTPRLSSFPKSSESEESCSSDKQDLNLFKLLTEEGNRPKWHTCVECRKTIASDCDVKQLPCLHLVCGPPYDCFDKHLIPRENPFGKNRKTVSFFGKCRWCTATHSGLDIRDGNDEKYVMLAANHNDCSCGLAAEYQCDQCNTAYCNICYQHHEAIAHLKKTHCLHRIGGDQTFMCSMCHVSKATFVCVSERTDDLILEHFCDVCRKISKKCPLGWKCYANTVNQTYEDYILKLGIIQEEATKIISNIEERIRSVIKKKSNILKSLQEMPINENLIRDVESQMEALKQHLERHHKSVYYIDLQTEHISSFFKVLLRSFGIGVIKFKNYNKYKKIADQVISSVEPVIKQLFVKYCHCQDKYLNVEKVEDLKPEIEDVKPDVLCNKNDDQLVKEEELNVKDKQVIETEDHFDVIEQQGIQIQTEKQGIRTELREIETEKQGIQTELQEIETEQQEFETDQQDFETDQQDFETDQQDFETDQQDLETDQQDFETDQQDFETDQQDFETDQQGIQTELQEVETEQQEFETDQQDFDAEQQNIDNENHFGETDVPLVENEESIGNIENVKTEVEDECIDIEIIDVRTIQEPSDNDDETASFHGSNSPPLEVVFETVPKIEKEEDSDIEVIFIEDSFPGKSNKDSRSRRKAKKSRTPTKRRKRRLSESPSSGSSSSRLERPSKRRKKAKSKDLESCDCLGRLCKICGCKDPPDGVNHNIIPENLEKVHFAMMEIIIIDDLGKSTYLERHIKAHCDYDEAGNVVAEASCSMCMDGGGLLVICDNKDCNRVFGDKCHIPAFKKIPDEETSWDCIFCVDWEKIKTKSYQDYARKMYIIPEGAFQGNIEEFLLACKFMSQLYSIHESLVVRFTFVNLYEEKFNRKPAFNLNGIRDRLINPTGNIVPYSSRDELLRDLTLMMKKASKLYTTGRKEKVYLSKFSKHLKSEKNEYFNTRPKLHIL